MKVAITGSTGRVGSATAAYLASVGHEVIGIDRIFRRETQYQVTIADLLQRENAYQVLAGCDSLVHFANHPGVGRRDAQTTITENLNVNTHVFQAAADLGIEKVVFASSIQVMTGDRRAGDVHGRPSRLLYLPHDSASPAVPENPYALSKQLSEEMLRYYATTAGMSAVAVRFPFIYQREWRLGRFPVSKVSYRLDEAFTFLDLSDAVRLVRVLLERNLPGFRIYFPAARESMVNRPAADLIREHYPDVPLKRPLDEIESLADTSLIEEETSWKPSPHDFNQEA